MFNKICKRIIIGVILCFSSLMVLAQDSDSVTGNSFQDTMRSHDKIYVVMVVCIVILLVMILYLVRIDTRITRKEKHVQK